jgi:hypothetical protein
MKKAVAWPPRVPSSVTAKGIKRMSGRLLTPSEYFSNLVFSTRRRATSGDGGLETTIDDEFIIIKKKELIIYQFLFLNFYYISIFYFYSSASVPVLPRAARQAPLVASTCCILGVA